MDVTVDQEAEPTPICAIGASAGGIGALQEFFRRIDDNLGIAYVVIVHLAPDYPSHLAEILGQWRDGGIRETRFLIGAADGHSEAQRQEADLLLAFGSATWPHLLARASCTPLVDPQ